MTRWTILIGILGLSLAACQSSDQPAAGGSEAAKYFNGPAGITPPINKPLALLGDQIVTWDDLHSSLLEAAGGEALAEWVLDRAVAGQLHSRRLTVGQAQMTQEKSILAAALSSDADEAQRLLEQMRQMRGWGDDRFSRLLARNAGLRMLVEGQVQVTDADLHRAFDFRYGPRYEVRLIVLDTLQQCTDVARRTRAGESFMDLAIQYSTDASKAQGGLLSPISIEDPSYPPGLRTAIAKLAVGQISDPVALEHGFAMVRLERKIDAQSVRFDDVNEELKLSVRREMEQALMARLAREMLAQADLTVFDPWLQKSWERQRKAATQ